MISALATTSTYTGSPVSGVIVGVGSVILYFVPTIVAWLRHVPGKGSVTVVNVFLGWTVIGWIVALAMACRSRPQPQSANVTITH
jgi:hypothetical protein